MIIHRLIARHLKHGDDAEFYRLQGDDAITWLINQAVPCGPKTRVLDLGCGHGIFGRLLTERECQVSYADQENQLAPDLRQETFIPIDLDHDSFTKLGQHDLVICSNVLEHLANPDRFLTECRSILLPGGHLYLSWTNWLSPWGGHDFSPFHYLGPQTGHRIFDRIIKRERIHTPFETLYPTYIGEILRKVDQLEGLEVVRTIPRYYPELAVLMKIPWLREFTAWNCAMLIRRADGPAEPA